MQQLRGRGFRTDLFPNGGAPPKEEDPLFAKPEDDVVGACA